MEEIELDEFVDARFQRRKRRATRPASTVIVAAGNSAFSRRIAGNAVTKSPIWSSFTTRMRLISSRVEQRMAGEHSLRRLLVRLVVVGVARQPRG